MTDITQLAKGEPCLIMLPECGPHDPETTVACHFRKIGLSGMGKKPPDLFIAFGCFNCHDAVDRRRYMHLELEYVRLAHAIGVMKTQARLIELGVIHW